MKAGLIYDMDDETYHGDPVPGGSLSSTFARLLTEHVPAKAIERFKNRKPTRAMNFGKAVHAHALGAGPQLIVWEHDGRTKDGKAERAEAAPLLDSEAAVAVSGEQRDQLLAMAEALRSDPRVWDIFEASSSEVSGFATEGSVWLRARYDLLNDEAAHDYKTCESATARFFSKALASWGYHQQSDFYLRVLRTLDHPAGNRPMRFICQETEPPYLVQIHEPDAEAMGVAAAVNDRAIGIFAEATKTGIWPGYPALTPEPTALPTYYWFNYADVLPDEWRPVQEMEIA